MNISSPAFVHQQKIPSQYTCSGDNISPPLQFGNVPQEAKSLVLIVDDPDAPSGTWAHWVVYNIAPNISEVRENSIPDNGIEATTSFGNTGYGGPCPPSGEHRYFFKLYAINTLLNLPEDANKQIVEEAMQGHIVGQAELIGLYSKE